MTAFDPAGPFTTERLEGFLRATKSYEEPPAERLRRLAIYLEHRATGGWRDLRMIYRSALEFTPDDARIHHSMGVSARRLLDANAARLPGPERQVILDEARAALDRALELELELPEAIYTRGLLEARHGPSVAAALVWLEWALESRPGDPLYAMAVGDARDLNGDLEGAIEIYESIDGEALERAAHGRDTERLARLGRGYLALGRTADAAQAMEKLIDALEALDPTTRADHLHGLSDTLGLIRGLRPALLPRVERLQATADLHSEE